MEKTGWPWSSTRPKLQKGEILNRNWPKVTIVTPSFNQGQYIEETIRSVLLQGYPNLEYIIMDGGSKDQSVDIIGKYSPWISFWESQPDRGQADAINKALRISTGDIFHFINSDDVLAEGAIFAVVNALQDNDAVAGAVEVFQGDKTLYVARSAGLTPELMLNTARHAEHCTFHQPGVWLKRANILQLGGFDETFRYCFDSHLFIQYAERWPNVRYIDDTLVRFRMHEASKSVSEIGRFGDEFVAVRVDLSTKLSSHRLRKYAALTAKRFRWRTKFEIFLNDKQSRSLKSACSAIPTIFFRPHLSWDREGLHLIRTSFDRIRNAIRIRTKARGPQSSP